MKKIIINLSDCDYEKLRFEAIKEEKDITQILRERIFFKPFSGDVLDSFDSWMDNEINTITEGF